MSTDVSAESIEYRRLRPAELSLVADIDRTEHIEAIYQRRGFEPMAEPFPELYELEPEDVHLQKSLGSS